MGQSAFRIMEFNELDITKIGALEIAIAHNYLLLNQKARSCYGGRVPHPNSSHSFRAGISVLEMSFGLWSVPMGRV